MKEPGQVGYEAYRSHTDGKSLATGQDIPEWHKLSDAIRKAWGAAHTAILNHHGVKVAASLPPTDPAQSGT